MKRLLYSRVALITDVSSEAKSFIDRYIGENHTVSGNLFARVAQLGRDLGSYIDRPNFVQEVLNQLASSGTSFYVVSAAWNLADALTIDQIGNLIQDKQGSLLVDSIQIFINPANNTGVTGVTINQIKQAFLKIESVRVPIIVNDSRPYMGDMVAENEDLGIDPSIVPGRTHNSFRFGGGHDGEHWLTKNIGAQIKATPGISGTVLTYYNIDAKLWAVMILLKDRKTVLLLKDLATLGSKIKEAPRTYPDLAGSKFTDKSGKPIEEIPLNSNEIIGTTSHWSIAKLVFQSKYAGTEMGTFHFAFLKYDFAQQYRSYGAGKSTITPDEIRDKLSLKIQEKTTSIHWFISPCSPESPVKCFK